VGAVRPRRRHALAPPALCRGPGDGFLSHDELRAALQLQRARLGWDDAYTQGWAAYVLDVVPHEPRGIRHKELFSALRDWSELRQLFSAREPSEALREAAPRAGEWTKNVFDLFRR